MNNKELKLHHPVKLEIEWWYGPRTMIASVYEFCDNDHRRYRIVDINGQIETINAENVISVLNCDLSEQEAMALICLSMLYESKSQEEKKYQESLHKIQDAIRSTTKQLKNATGFITTEEFIDEVNDILARKVGYDTHVRASSAKEGAEYVDIAVEKYITKHADPQRFRFIRRDCDQTLKVDTQSDDYKVFVERNAPDKKAVLEKLAFDKHVGVTLGKGNSLSVNRAYKVRLQDGFTRKQLDELEKML
jgi:hypothetical protein